MAALAPTRVPLDAALGHVLVEGVVAGEAIPPFANTAMDGFAVRAADTGPGARLALVGTVAAGAPWEGRLGSGQALRIMTGAPMPDGADAVVMVERARVSGDEVVVEVAVEPGTHVRPAGDDIRPGDEVLSAGVEITPAALGLLHTLGVPEVRVVSRPRVAVMSTGDELVEAGEVPGPGQIRDSNRPMLGALAAVAGAEVVDLGLVPDDPERIEAALTAGAARADLVVSSGGVSMGDFDYVKAVLDRVADMRWMQVAIKPAKPLAVGSMATADGRRVTVLGLPGNPVSSAVSFELFARPAIRALAGHRELHRPRRAAVAAEDLRRRSDGKVHFVRVVTEHGSDGGLVVRSAGGQGSHHTAALAGADGLAVLPDGEGVAAGEAVTVIEI